MARLGCFLIVLRVFVLVAVGVAAFRYGGGLFISAFVTALVLEVIWLCGVVGNVLREKGVI